jgi:group I intron endonuclease
MDWVVGYTATLDESCPVSGSRDAAGIYLIRSRSTGLSYIGQSRRMAARFATHRYSMKPGKPRRYSEKLTEHVKARGLRDLEFVVLELCEVSCLLERERHWLSVYRESGAPIANSDGPSDRPWAGQRHRASTIEKIRSYGKGKPKSAEHRAKIGLAHKGRTLSDTTKKKISALRRGTPMPKITGERNPACRPEARARVSLNNPMHRLDVRKRQKENVRRARVLDVVTGEEWPSMVVCAADIGVSVSSVSLCVNGKTKSSGGRALRRHFESLVDRGNEMPSRSERGQSQSVPGGEGK